MFRRNAGNYSQTSNFNGQGRPLDGRGKGNGRGLGKINGKCRHED